MEKNFGETIRDLREERNLLLRELAAKLEMDTSLLSKIETNSRIAKRELIEKFATVFKVDFDELMLIWISDRIVNELMNQDNIDEILKLAEQKLKFGKYGKK